MSKYFGSKEITARYFGRKVIVAAYKGLHLIWQIVKSCFGGGYWRDDKPWKDDECWKD